MAYSFNGTNQWISAGSAPATAAPVTIAAHFYKTGTATKNGIFLRSAAVSNQLIGFYFGSSSSVRGFLQQGGIQPDFAASGSYTINTWGHACLVCESSVLRTIYRNGGNSAQNTTSATPASLDRLDIAAVNGTSTFDGRFAEVGIWSAALNADEVASLAGGFTCDKVRPQSLVFYAPLIRDLTDIRGALALTNNNSATVTDHPRVY